jgi:hypothetical protein
MIIARVIMAAITRIRQNTVNRLSWVIIFFTGCRFSSKRTEGDVKMMVGHKKELEILSPRTIP